MKSRFLILLSLCLFSGATLAEKRHHEAHIHGVAELNIVIENDTILIEFESPAVNLIGFEHKPRNDTQQLELQNALALLNDVDIIASFEKGKCRATETHVRGPFDDDDQEGSEHDVQEEHSEFHAVYTLSCQNASAISPVRTQLFDRFPGFEAIRVRWVGSKGQGTALLNNQSTIFSIE